MRNTLSLGTSFVGLLTTIIAAGACGSGTATSTGGGGGGASGTTSTTATTGGGHGGEGAGTSASSSSGASTGGSGGGAAPGTSCDQAIDITDAIATSGTYHGDATATAAISASCTAQNAAVAYLKYKVPAADNYRFMVHHKANNPAAPEAALFVRTGCDAGAFELACGDQAGFLETRVGLPAADQYAYITLAGDYYKGGFDLDVGLSVTCVDPIDCLVVDGGKQCTADGVCVQCVADGDCSVGDCSSPWQVCAACTPASCAGNPKGSACDTVTQKCGCVDSSDCPAGLTCGPQHVCGDALPEVLVQGTQLASVQCLVANDTNVYYYTSGNGSGSVWSVPVAGGVPTVLGNAEAMGLAIDGSYVYWIGSYAVQRKPLGGGPIETLYTGSLLGIKLECGGIAVDGTHLYTVASSGILKIPLAGGPPVVLASGEKPTYLAINGSDVFFTGSSPSVLKSVPKIGGVVSVRGSAIERDVEVDDSDAFVIWSTGNPENLLRIPLGGGPATTLFDTAPLYPSNFNGWAMASDASNIYTPVEELGTQTSFIYKVPKAGGAPAVLAKTSHMGDIVSDVAINSTHVFWANGNLERASK